MKRGHEAIAPICSKGNCNVLTPGIGVIECGFVYVDMIFVGLGMNSESFFFNRCI